MPLRVLVESVLKIPRTELEAGTSTVGEPSIAQHGDQILFTGNWYVARSTDGGTTWEGFDPGNYFPENPPTDFSCDQSVMYVPRHDLFVWILQYEESTKDNTLRIAVKRGAERLDEGNWYTWDLTPADIHERWTNQWFDYNHIATTDTHLFVGSNVFRIGEDQMLRSAVIRISFDSLLASIEAGTGLEIDFFSDPYSGTLRCTLGARDTMYIAGQRGNDRLRLMVWPDADAVPSTHDIPVREWVGGNGYSSAPGPDRRRWLRRADDRITGGWVANGEIGFLWTANRVDERRPFPYIRVVVLDERTLEVRDEPDIWSAKHGYAWADVCPNTDGVVGVTLFRGGGGLYPGHVVGVRNPAGGKWLLVPTVDGGVGHAKWGDYLTCRRRSPDDGGWIATGYTLQGRSSERAVRPFAIRFSWR
jgi:hypothetical protein